ncbi:hypothetical protein OIE61_39605 [Streptomyces sp. NBC_01762]|uniref:hypothetical protein n=1 Tax=unclassified Streptomyces TaxID=2593676 RepID=UPI002DD86A87|nr:MULTISPECIES: hypothetical protein [unclassified Streptomyces]WSC49534.1 hypothetical protein OIE61_39605 [Streptomyces sp. NBC_01762]WSD29106.1 hypothetical protein OHA26_39920 [Streptomyces sp. NBC_01751]
MSAALAVAGGHERLLDVVAIEVPEVAANGTARATARSHRDLTSTVAAEVRDALRY